MLLERVRTVAERGISRGAFRGIELAVGCDGAPPFTLQLGQVGGQLWTCASKCLLAVALATLVGDGATSYDEKLGQRLPELAASDWGLITVYDVLSHSVGFTADIGVLSVFLSDEEVLSHCAGSPLHPTNAVVYTRWTGSFLLGQFIARVTGRSFAAYLIDKIGSQLGLMGTELSYPAGYLPQLAESIRPLLTIPQIATHVPPAGSGSLRPLDVRDDRVWPGVSPGGPMADLVKVLAALVPARAAANGLISSAVAREVTSVHRSRSNGWLSETNLGWGLGVAVDQRLVIPTYSANTFGHFGDNGTVLVFADPGRDIVAGLRLVGIGAEASIPLRRAAILNALLGDIQEERGEAKMPKSVNLRLSH